MQVALVAFDCILRNFRCTTHWHQLEHQKEKQVESRRLHSAFLLATLSLRVQCTHARRILSGLAAYISCHVDIRVVYYSKLRLTF